MARFIEDVSLIAKALSVDPGEAGAAARRVLAMVPSETPVKISAMGVHHSIRPIDIVSVHEYAFQYCQIRLADERIIAAVSESQVNKLRIVSEVIMLKR